MSCLVALAALSLPWMTGSSCPPAAPIIELLQDPVPRMESAEAQLRHAVTVRLGMLRKRSRALALARQRALDAFLAVAEYHPQDKARAAEALFRAGELARAGGDSTSALLYFADVRTQGARTPFRARAGLEIGHVHRRAGRLEDAKNAYDNVMLDDSASIRFRDRASYWCARVLVAMGRSTDARRLFRRVATSSYDSLQRIRAFDELVLLTVSNGDLEWAAGILEECRKSLAKYAKEQTRQGQRVRSALDRMRSIPVLKKAVRERRLQKKPVVTDKNGSASNALNGA